MTKRDSGGNRRILVIDDNPAIHEDLRKILVADGDGSGALQEAKAALFGDGPERAEICDFEIDSAYQGQEGLELVSQAVRAERPFAMAFVDVHMPPGWDGIETVAHLWQEDPRLQVVICTAYTGYSWDKMTEELGPTDRLLILKKPFDNVEVKQLACALTEKWNLTQQTTRKVDGLEEAVLERTRDLQDQKRDLENTVEQLNQAHVQLLQAQKLESIGQLAAGIAHEINTPTQFVGDNTRFLKDSFDDLTVLLRKCDRLVEAGRNESVTQELVTEFETALKQADVEYLLDEIPKSISQSLEGIERVAKIVRSMKEFSHPGGDEMQATDLNKAIETTVTVARNEWKYVADMVTEFDHTLPTIPCLVGEFNQVILNMIVNAAHAIADVVGAETGDKGTITITTRLDGDHAEIRIGDTGTGMTSEVRSRIFDPFFTTKEVGKGTGQGLAIARTAVVKKHGGTIHVESQVGQGTTFIIRLPIDQKPNEPAETRKHETANRVC